MLTTIEAAVQSEATGIWNMATCEACGKAAWVTVVHVDAVCDECREALQSERAAGAANRCYGWPDAELMAEAVAVPSPEVKWSAIEAVATEWGFYPSRHYTAGDASLMVAHMCGLRETYSEREVHAALYLRCA